MKRAIGSFLCATLLVTSGIALAAPNRPHTSREHAQLEQQLRNLALEPEQKAEIDTILAASEREHADLSNRLRPALKELTRLLERYPPDEQAIFRQADKIGGLRTERQKMTLRALLEVRSKLTPEQRAELDNMRRAAKAGGRKGKRSTAPPAKS